MRAGGVDPVVVREPGGTRAAEIARQALLDPEHPVGPVGGAVLLSRRAGGPGASSHPRRRWRRGGWCSRTGSRSRPRPTRWPGAGCRAEVVVPGQPRRGRRARARPHADSRPRARSRAGAAGGGAASGWTGSTRESARIPPAGRRRTIWRSGATGCDIWMGACRRTGSCRRRGRRSSTLAPERFGAVRVERHGVSHGLRTPEHGHSAGPEAV